MKRLEAEIRNVMDAHDLDTFPSRMFLDGIGRSDLFNAVAREGGFVKCAEEWGIPRKKRTPKWTLGKIEEELKEYIQFERLDRMPSKPELMKVGRHDLANALTRYKGMKYWSERIGMPLKDSETTKGRIYEEKVKEKIEHLGHEVNQMTTKHAYDLLVNNHVKVDVKVASPGITQGYKTHTFRPSKEYPTCDLYVCVALDEVGKVEKTFVIPSKFAQVTTLCIMENSKYNSFIDRWAYIDRYTEFYNTLKAEGIE